MKYQEYMHSARWSQRRASKLEQARYRCEKCGERDGLAVHHLTYKTLGHEASEDLLVLCPSCHWLADEIRKGNTTLGEQQFYAPREKTEAQRDQELRRDSKPKQKTQPKRKHYGTEYARSWLDELKRGSS